MHGSLLLLLLLLLRCCCAPLLHTAVASQQRLATQITHCE
jgi:hypothetical protein